MESTGNASVAPVLAEILEELKKLNQSLHRPSGRQSLQENRKTSSQSYDDFIEPDLARQVQVTPHRAEGEAEQGKEEGGQQETEEESNQATEQETQWKAQWEAEQEAELEAKREHQLQRQLEFDQLRVPNESKSREMIRRAFLLDKSFGSYEGPVFDIRLNHSPHSSDSHSQDVENVVIRHIRSQQVPAPIQRVHARIDRKWLSSDAVQLGAPIHWEPTSHLASSVSLQKKFMIWTNTKNIDAG